MDRPSSPASASFEAAGAPASTAADATAAATPWLARLSQGQPLLEWWRHDVTALSAAHRQSWHSLDTLGRRQFEIVLAAAQAWQEGVREVMALSVSSDKARVTVRRSRRALQQSLEDLGELNELATRPALVLLTALKPRWMDPSVSGQGGRRTRAEPVDDRSPKALPPSRRQQGRTLRRNGAAAAAD